MQDPLKIAGSLVLQIEMLHIFLMFKSILKIGLPKFWLQGKMAKKDIKNFDCSQKVAQQSKYVWKSQTHFWKAQIYLY